MVNDNLIVDVRPFRVMIHSFGRDRGFGHKTECFDERRKLKGFVQLARLDGPARKLRQLRGDLRFF